VNDISSRSDPRHFSYPRKLRKEENGQWFFQTNASRRRISISSLTFPLNCVSVAIVRKVSFLTVQPSIQTHQLDLVNVQTGTDVLLVLSSLSPIDTYFRYSSAYSWSTLSMSFQTLGRNLGRPVYSPPK
jgi:hypothetical protein